MKRAGFLVIAILFAITIAGAQVDPVYNITDSTGTATTTAWQIITLYSAFNKPVTVENKSTSTDTLLVALAAGDTVISRTRYRKPVAPQTSYTVWTTNNYVYVKANTNTVSYSVYLGEPANAGALRRNDSLIVRFTTDQPVTANVVFGSTDSVTVYHTTPQPVDQKDKSFSILDSISVNTVAPSTTYAANDNVGAALLIFRNVNDYSGQGVTVTNLTMFADTGNTTNATFFNNFLRDSTGIGAFTDNAAFALPAANWNANFVERVVLALANTYGLTTFAEGSTNVSPFVVVPTGRNVYVRVTAGAAWLGKYNGKLYARIRGYKN